MDAELSKAAADRADLARVRAGDVEAFANVVRRWQTPLINLAYRFCGDRGRAEEMAQCWPRCKQEPERRHDEHVFADPLPRRADGVLRGPFEACMFTVREMDEIDAAGSAH